MTTFYAVVRIKCTNMLVWHKVQSLLQTPGYYLANLLFIISSIATYCKDGWSRSEKLTNKKKNVRIAYRFSKCVSFSLSHHKLKFSCKLKFYSTAMKRKCLHINMNESQHIFCKNRSLERKHRIYFQLYKIQGNTQTINLGLCTYVVKL